MTLTNNELLFLNSLQDGRAIFGVGIKPAFFASDEFVDSTIEGLKQKGYIQENGKLSKEIMVPAMALEQYKSAETYVVFDTIRAALTVENKVVSIIERKEKYTLLSCLPEEFLHILISSAEILNTDLDRSCAETELPFQDQELAELIQENEYSHSCILLKHQKGKTTYSALLFWNKDTIMLYNNLTGLRRECNGHQLRLLLLELFEMDKKVQNVWEK